MTIVLNSMSNKSCISTSLRSVTKSLLYFFGGAIFLWFFMIPVILCGCPHIWSSFTSPRHFGLTLARKDPHLWVWACWNELWSQVFLWRVPSVRCVVGLGPVGMNCLTQATGIYSINNSWPLAITVGVLNGFKGCWCPQSFLQVLWLGTRAGSGGSWNWWVCTHTAWGLQVPV